MKITNRFLVPAGAALLGLVIGAVMVAMLGNGSPGDPARTAAVDGVEVWTCSMHPQIRQPAPGKCPICAMDLIPLGSSPPSAGPRQLAMSPEAMALAQIDTTPVVRSYPEVEVRLYGKIAHDETRVRELAARFPARIDRLFVDYTGIRVAAGDHLAEVYSPELLTAQGELLSARRFDNTDAVNITRDKLRLWGLPDDKIREVETSGTTSDRLVINAPIGGIVTGKHVREGEYVETGTPLFEIADLSAVWLILDAYASDLVWLRFGQTVTFTVDGIPGQTFEGQVAFISPELDPASRTVKVRVNVENPERTLKPGMFASATATATIAGQGRVLDPSLEGKWISPMHPEIVKDEPGTCDICGMPLVPAAELGYTTPDSEAPPPLLIPASAVLHTGERSVVYVQVPDKESPTYEGVEITLGPRAGDHYVVADGLEEGQRVVSKGAFKIDSALQIEAKPSMMSPESHQHAPEGRSDIPLDDYLAAQAALADDDFEAVQKVPAFAGAGDLAAARELFHQFSAGLIAEAKAGELGSGQPLALAHCPMAFDFNGADWLQPEGPVRNPYFGHEMLECGSIKHVFPPAPKDGADDGGEHQHAGPEAAGPPSP